MPRHNLDLEGYVEKVAVGLPAVVVLPAASIAIAGLLL